MRKISLKAGSLFIFAFVIAFASCKKDKNIPVEDNRTTFDVLSTNKSFTYLMTALKKADLESNITSKSGVTIFAPSNQAFIDAGFPDEAFILAQNKETLANILNYHIIDSAFRYEPIDSAIYKAISTTAGKPLFIMKRLLAGVTFTSATVNGTRVVNRDAKTKNGNINVITKLLIPPMGNIVETAKSKPSLSFLVVAIERASQGNTNLAEVLSDSNLNTVFAPTNEAFIAANYADIAAVKAADPATLSNILLYHVLPGRVFSTNFGLDISLNPTTLQGSKISITPAGIYGQLTASVKGFNNNASATVTAIDVVATNGVMHIIDKLLLPPN